MSKLIRVDFSNVYSLVDLQKQEVREAMDHKGVYIWGFVFSKVGKNLSKSPIDSSMNIIFDPKIHVFIPFYTGQSTNDTVLKCIESRHANSSESSVRSKYIILSHQYLTSFYNDDYFPIDLGKKSEPIRKWFDRDSKRFQGKLLYYNNRDILTRLYDLHPDQLPKTANDDYPSDQFIKVLRQNNRHHDAELLAKHILEYRSKIFFCYTVSNILEFKLNPRNLETYLYYRLIGKTCSQHYSFAYAKSKFEGFHVEINSQAKIFKETISEGFNGVYQ